MTLGMLDSGERRKLEKSGETNKYRNENYF